MGSGSEAFFDKIFSSIKEGRADNVPLVEFKHPKELEKILDLDVTEATCDEALVQCVRQVVKYSVKTNQPMFRNQLDGGTDPYGLAASYVAEAFNTSQYTFEVAPAFTLIEKHLLSHVLNVFGIPEGDGIFSPGGSISLFYGIVAARYKAFPEVKPKGVTALPELVIFTSEDSHYSVKKAAHWLGFGTDYVREIQTDDSGRMVTEDLDAAIEKEKQLGRFPLLVNTTVGTTVIGAIDDLHAVADVCQKHGIWLHADASWGGSLILSEKYRSRLSGIERANSIVWNAHKMMGAPLYCSLFLVRERGLLHEANSAAAHYLFQQDKFYDVSYDTGDKSVQCGRKVDAFKLWLMWKARGDAGLGSLVDHTMSTAEFCHNTVASRPGYRLVLKTLHCPNVCFWYIPTFMRGQEEDDEWWEVMHKVAPMIKQLMTLSGRLLVGFCPLRQRKNFFRLTFTCHPQLTEDQVLDMLAAIEDCGEMLRLDGGLRVKENGHVGAKLEDCSVVD